MGAPCIVPEALTKDNYGSWAIWMKNYLVGKELWDVVEGSEAKPDESTQPNEFKAWRRKNGKALYAIQVSCGPECFGYIKDVYFAKAAWDNLSFLGKPPSFEPSSSRDQVESSDDKTWRRLLYKAVVEGNWEKTRDLIEPHPEASSARLFMGETILHTAVLHKHAQLVEELVNYMPPEDLIHTLPYWDYGTALHLAALGGVVKIAKALVNKNGILLCLRDNFGRLPVTLASTTGHKAMLVYLFSVTPEAYLLPSAGNDGATLLSIAILSEEYDFALEVYQRCPQLSTARNAHNTTALQVLASLPSAFPSGCALNFWRRWIFNCIDLQSIEAENTENNVLKQAIRGLKGHIWVALKVLAPAISQIYDMKLKHKRLLELLKKLSNQVSSLNTTQIEESGVISAVMEASENGIVEIVVELVNSIPALLWIYTEFGGIFHAAIAHRQERIWNLIYGVHALQGEITSFANTRDSNSLLHVAGCLAPANRLRTVSGTAMQMQRELQWFKEVEKMVPPWTKESVNKAGRTAQGLFTEQHKDLVKEGEDWLKDTAASCMVVATLIATVMFAAAFTVPGGNHDQTGMPILERDRFFMVFLISDALSLFSSSTSVLMFLSIFTSRFAEEDFLRALPKRLIIGLATLFLSIATMMTAFSATMVIMLKDRYRWVAIPVSLFGSVPVTFFALLQFPLFVEMVSSTYGSGIFGKQTLYSLTSVHKRTKLSKYLDA